MSIHCVVCNGELPSEEVLRRGFAGADAIVCADGAANSLRDRAFTPHVIIGDLDSAHPETLAHYGDRVTVMHRPSQFATDLEKALRHCVDSGAKEVVVTGVTGRRLDHSLTNWNILERFVDEVQMHVFDDYGWGTFVVARGQAKTLRLKTSKGMTVSLIPFGEAGGITTQGLLYPLNNESLVWGQRDGQSNEATAGGVEVRLESGVLLVFACGLWGYEHFSLGAGKPE